MNEETLKQKLLSEFKKTPNCYLKKYNSGMYSAGMPDLIGYINEKFIAIEVKVITLPKRETTAIKPFKNVTPLQKVTIQDINDNSISKKCAFVIAGGLDQKGKLKILYITDMWHVWFFVISNVDGIIKQLINIKENNGKEIT